MPPSDERGAPPGTDEPGTVHRHTNRLAGETSPYLLQHAHNPVDWYPWGEEALRRARETDRPIFLSIGYAACHWCHVMERESFEDEVTAAALNDGFVAIKVDREERPDLDAIYMDAVQAITGSGGWPMSVFLTPDGRPFYGGTYFPDAPRHGMPSFRQVLAGVREAWERRRDEVESSAATLVEAVARGQRGAQSTATALGLPTGGDANLPGSEVLEAARAALESSFDARTGGWGGAPKFPQAMAVEFLLREHLRTGDTRPLAVARRSLDAMAAGGIYDHLGGGFCRYATDATWLVPHFEKMLYDNALLARAYLHAWQVTGEPRYREVVRETLDFVARELRTPADGAFAASLDADTLGVEGATYVWSAADVRRTLGEDAPLFEAAYGVTEGGNWEGHTILSRVRDDADLARRLDLRAEEVGARLSEARARLLAARDERPQPTRDGKVLAAWNGLMLAAFAEAGRGLPEDRYTGIATAAATFLLEALRTPEGRLLRSWKDDRAQHAGVLEDHADLAEGLLALYETSLDERWFTAARDLADLTVARFADPELGFFDTADDAEALIARPRGLQDNAVPSGGAMVSTLLLRLHALTGDPLHRGAAERAVGPVAPLAARYPQAFAQWLQALQLALVPIDELAIVGDPGADDTRALLAAVRGGHWPWRVVAVAADPDSSSVPLLHGRRRLDDRATAYVCRGFACRMPVSDPAELAAQLAEPARAS